METEIELDGSLWTSEALCPGYKSLQLTPKLCTALKNLGNWGTAPHPSSPAVPTVATGGATHQPGSAPFATPVCLS